MIWSQNTVVVNLFSTKFLGFMAVCQLCSTGHRISAHLLIWTRRSVAKRAFTLESIKWLGMYPHFEVRYIMYFQTTARQILPKNNTAENYRFKAFQDLSTG